MIRTYTDIEMFLRATKVDGILLTGGNDLSDVSENELSKLRDAKEGEILDYAIRQSIPVYGVCRGMQFIAAYFGSTFKPISGHVAVRHAIEVTNQFWGSNILAQTEEVNSYHKYCIDNLAKNLQCTSVSGDGSIESFIHGEIRISGQMWHPEREKPFKSHDFQMIETFFSQ